MDEPIAAYRIHQCSKCPGDTEYSCKSCLSYLCHQCKENHVKDLETAEHNVVSYCDKLNYIPTQDNCLKHPCNAYSKYCESCHVPVCDICSEHEHKSHSFRSNFSWHCNILNEQSDYTRKRQQHICIIHTIKSETIFRIPFILQGIKADVKNCHKKSFVYHSEISEKAKKLKYLINKVIYDLLKNVLCDFDFKHRCLEQKIEMSRHIVSLQRYVQMYEQSTFTFSALQFLSSIKTALDQIHLTRCTSQLSMTESLVKENVMESLSRIKITEKGIRRVGNQCLLKLMPSIKVHKHLRLRRMSDIYHISCVTSDRVWVSDREGKLVLITTTGDPLHCHTNVKRYGCHTLNSKNELIFVDSDHTIKMLSEKMNTPKTIFKIKDKTCRPQCVYWSPSTKDLLVGIYEKNSKTGKVIRYNQGRKQQKTIPDDNTKMTLFIQPIYITQNNNGDVVVSDSDGAVVVTERGGRHRFSHTGHPSGSGLRPRGICTDALSHILVCDGWTNTVQMLDKDGQFLSHLLIRPSGIFKPLGLSYDAKNHRLLIGSWYNNNLCVYRYISRQDALGDQNTTTSNDMVSSRANQTTDTEKQEQEHGSPLKIMHDTPKSFEVTDINNCYHISCVTSDRVWVSDSDYNLILTDTTGVLLHCVEDSCYDFCGSHTVNSENDLIYIDKNYKIIKLMNDLKSTNTFFTQNDSTWKPRCLYWSPSTGELLVGRYRKELTYTGILNVTKFNPTGQVIRYNQSGQLTQTIQYDDTGLELYRQPNYITENNNGDVVVSDYVAVVVTERGGRHRFSYTGHPSGSGLRPRGICTNALSHILVCDVITNTIHIIDMDGNFLLHFFTKSEIMDDPHSLSYNKTTDHLWVGSLSDKKLCVYRYISRQNTPTVDWFPIDPGLVAIGVNMMNAP